MHSLELRYIDWVIRSKNIDKFVSSMFNSSEILNPLNLSTLSTSLMPTFRIMSSVLDDHGEIVPDLGPTINENESKLSCAFKIFFKLSKSKFLFLEATI